MSTQTWRGRAAVAAAAVAAALFSSPAQAQDALPQGTGYDLHLFRHAIDSKGQFTVNGTDILGAGSVSFGLVVDWGRGLARRGTGLRGSEQQLEAPLVTNMFSGVLHGNVGIANWLVLGLQMPFHLVDGPAYSGSETTLSPIGGYSPQNGGLTFQGVGTLMLHAKLRLLRAERSGFGLALIVQGGFPAMSGPANFAGDPGAVVWPSIAAEWRPNPRFRMDLNLGYRHAFGNPAQLVNTVWGSPVTFGLGLSFRAAPALDIVAEAYGSTATNDFFGEFQTPVEAVLGLKVFVIQNSYLLIGGGRRLTNGDAGADVRAFIGFVFEPSIGDRDGDGYRDDVDRCPDEPEDFDNFEDQDGCPEPDNDQDGILDVNDHCPLTPEDRDGDADDDGCPDRDVGDRDGDGILDSVDQCPDNPEDRDNFEDQDGCPEPDNDRDGILDRNDLCPNDPEDRDGFEDEEGCPDPDNDHDRIPDVRDRCPLEPETYNGTEDEDGCPDRGDAVLEENSIRILQAINFETDSAQIMTESIHIVEAVAAILRANPQIQLLQVQGHADERGNDEHNLQLTRDRAASVVRALRERGVEEERLHSAGYGERCPLTNGHNEAAWSRNRRVEFRILRTAAGVTRERIVCPAGEALMPEEDRNLQ
ncbi:MAG: OmpA family protein [Polyangiales bacterium]